jgi:hypothetical protein
MSQDTQLFHLTNGGAGRRRLLEGGVPGEIAAWHDMLWDGPVATDLRVFGSLDARARWVEEHYGVPCANYSEQHLQDEAWLDARAQDGPDAELILWFEDDHYCEINLLYILSRLAAPIFKHQRISLVFAPGPLGLADLNFDLHAAFVFREQLSRNRMARASLAWRRYCDRDPRAFAVTSLPPPFEAFTMRWRSRFPDENGLSLLDRHILRHVSERETSASALFRELCLKANAPARGLGLGDLQLWRVVNELRQRGLLELTGPPLPRYGDEEDSPSPARTRVRISPTGLRSLRRAGTPPSHAPVGGAHGDEWTRRELEELNQRR